MIRRPPRSTRTAHSFPTRRSSDLNRGLNSSFTVRKMSHGVGVERVFQAHSPLVVSIEVVRRVDVARAKLYYLRSEEHTSELQSLMRISYAVFCLQKNI